MISLRRDLPVLLNATNVGVSDSVVAISHLGCYVSVGSIMINYMHFHIAFDVSIHVARAMGRNRTLGFSTQKSMSI